ncbi:MAG: hypothetical protein U0974_07125 [Gemmatimonadales bacterium]|nr:hypothetical protein [Gemmatimonadales bacterium]MDZ4389484.1 hypothetical protein [Gemmatimonadales bacterium]
MTTSNSLLVRSFTERADALAHAIQRAGEAPRVMAYDDTVGCPTETLLGALEWTRVVGVLPDDDLLHAGRLTGDTAAAVVERRDEQGHRWIFIGPRLDIPQLEPLDGEVLLDQPGVKAIAFPDRALALAHFLRVTGGVGAILAQLGRRAPELRHVRRWLGPIVNQLDSPRRLVAGWFAASAGGSLFVGDPTEEDPYRYIEVGIES